ncbi:MAG TPA: hypothetical protein VIM96_10595 [Pseudomonadales bacterium]
MQVILYVIAPLAITLLLLLWAARDKQKREPILALILTYFLSRYLAEPFNFFAFISIVYFFASKSGPQTIDKDAKRANIIYFLALLIIVKKQLLTTISFFIKYKSGSLGVIDPFLVFGLSIFYPVLTLCVLVYYWKIRGGLWPLAKTPVQTRLLLLINACLGITVALYLMIYLSTTVMRLTVGIPADASFAVAYMRIYGMLITNIALATLVIATEIMRFISWRTPSVDDAQPQTAP